MNRSNKSHKNRSYRQHVPGWRIAQSNVDIVDHTNNLFDLYQPTNNTIQLNEDQQLRIAIEQSGALYMYELAQKRKLDELNQIKSLKANVEVVKFDHHPDTDTSEHKDDIHENSDSSVELDGSDSTNNNTTVAYIDYEYSDNVNIVLDQLADMLGDHQLESIDQLSILRNSIINDNNNGIMDAICCHDIKCMIQYADDMLFIEQQCIEIQQEELGVIQSIYGTDCTIHNMLPVSYTIQLKHDTTNTYIDVNMTLPTTYPIAARCNVKCYISPPYTYITHQLQSVVNEYVDQIDLSDDSTSYEILLYIKQWCDDCIDARSNNIDSKMQPSLFVFDWQQTLISYNTVEHNIRQQIKQLQAHHTSLSASNALAILRDQSYDVDKAITNVNSTNNSNTATRNQSYNHNRLPQHDYSTVHTCLSCWDDYTTREGILMLPCHHFMCKLCCAKLIVSHISVGHSFIKCSGHRCTEYISIGVISHLLHTDDYIKYTTWIQHNYTTISGYNYCSTLNCNTVFKLLDDDTLNHTGYIICECGSRQCNTCNKVAHYPMQCSSGDTYNTSDVIRNMRKQCGMLSNINMDDISIAETKACPKCSLRFEKSSGCNHISCPCGHNWCFICEQDWSIHGVSYYDCKFKRATKTRKLIYATTGVAISENISFVQFYIERELEHYSYQTRLTELYNNRNKLKQLNILLPDCTIDILYHTCRFLVDCHLILRHVYILCALYRDALENSSHTTITPNGQQLLQHINQLEMYVDILNSVLLPRYKTTTRVQRNTYQMQQTCNSTRKYVSQMINSLDVFLSVDAVRIHELYEDMDQNDAVKRMINTISDV